SPDREGVRRRRAGERAGDREDERLLARGEAIDAVRQRGEELALADHGREAAPEGGPRRIPSRIEREQRVGGGVAEGLGEKPRAPAGRLGEAARGGDPGVQTSLRIRTREDGRRPLEEDRGQATRARRQRRRQTTPHGGGREPAERAGLDREEHGGAFATPDRQLLAQRDPAREALGPERRPGDSRVLPVAPREQRRDGRQAVA